MILKEEDVLPRVGMVGNPNAGKSTVFNLLTGLRQQTGNFPGVTVEIKKGRMRFPSGKEAMLVDFPGTYSLYPTSSDEKLVAAVMTNPDDVFFPDALIYIADVTHLERHLLLLTQLLDLNLPVILALNMSDTASEMGIKVNTAKLSDQLGVPVISISGRKEDNIQRLLSEVEKMLKTPQKASEQSIFLQTNRCGEADYGRCSPKPGDRKPLPRVADPSPP